MPVRGCAARGEPQENTLAASFQSRQAYHLSPPKGYRAVVQASPAAFRTNLPKGQHFASRLLGALGRRCGRSAEHVGQDGFRVEGRLHFPRNPSLAKDGHPVAQGFHVFDLVTHHEDRSSFAGELLQRLEKHFLLNGGDPRGGLVQDEQSGSQGKQAQQFQLLPFPHRQGGQRRLGSRWKSKCSASSASLEAQSLTESLGPWTWPSMKFSRTVSGGKSRGSW